MQTKKLVEGGILSALQITLGFILIPMGIGYSFYVEILLPVMMALIILKCGKKVGLIAGNNTFLIITLVMGNVATSVYVLQGVGFGFLTGVVLKCQYGIQDDLLLQSLIGCLFLLILDYLTAGLLGWSLLDYDGIDQIVLAILPDANTEMIEMIYYLSVASVPIVAALITYIGCLILGYKIGFLKGRMKEKYYFIRYYKKLVSFAYHDKKVIRFALIGLLTDLGLWPLVDAPYLKAFVISSGAILLYFILMDSIKLIGQYILEKWRQPEWFMLYHIGVLVTLVMAFTKTCYILLIFGLYIDLKTELRNKQIQKLKFYTQHPSYLK